MRVRICFLRCEIEKIWKEILRDALIMKKILVLVQDYPNNNGGVALMYVHVRNKYYIQHNIDVTVLNFSSVDDYVIDNIRVITENTYKDRKSVV